MHPYDAKSIFFSEVDVLRGPQSTRHRVAYRHVILVGACVAARAGPVAVLVLSPQNAHFCYCMRITFAYVILAFTATFISYAFLPVLFHARTCRLLDYASGA